MKYHRSASFSFPALYENQNHRNWLRDCNMTVNIPTKSTNNENTSWLTNFRLHFLRRPTDWPLRLGSSHAQCNGWLCQEFHHNFILRLAKISFTESQLEVFSLSWISECFLHH